MDRRTRINLIAVGMATALLLSYATYSLLGPVLLNRSYPLFAELPVGAGLQANKEVTYNGTGIGLVREVVLNGTNVRVRMDINNSVQIPADVDIVVQRRSAIGEQAIDFRPIGPEGDATRYYEAGDTVVARQLVLPPEVQTLFQVANDVLEPIDPGNAGLVVAEIANAVRGRSEDVQAFLRDSERFSRAVADNGPAYDQLFASSRVVNAELAEHRGTIAGLITEMADATTILRDVRDEFEGLLTAAPPVLTQTANLFERGQANISCDLRLFANINEFTARPQFLEDASEALRTNRYFFEGFDALTPQDPFGAHWQRVAVVFPPGEPPATSYLPEKRPVRAILPGGACTSPFGPGAPAASQAGWIQRIPDTRVELPEDNRQQGVTRPAGAAAAPAAGSVPAGSGGAAGTAAAGLLVGGGMLAAWRRRGSSGG